MVTIGSESFALVSGEISLTASPGKAVKLTELRLHASGELGSGELTVTVDSAAGSNYDTVLFSSRMENKENISEAFDPPHTIKNGESIVVAGSNPGNKVVGCELIWEEI